MSREGYLIVQMPTTVLQSFESQLRIRGHQEQYSQFRAFFQRFDTSRYRGIARTPLIAVPSHLQPEFGDGVTEPAAQHLMSVLDGRDQLDDDALLNFDDACAVFDQIYAKSRFEIVHVSEESSPLSTDVLGFDVGYWGGDHFSLIADTIVTPTWHGPPVSDYSEVAERLSCLNGNLLFSSAAEAMAFRAYYKSKSWAETEDSEGEFAIIRICRMDLRVLRGGLH